MTKIISLLIIILLTAYSINAKTTYDTDTIIQGYCEVNRNNIYINNTSIPFPFIHDTFLNKKINIYHNLNIKPPGRFDVFDYDISSTVIPSADIVARVDGPMIIGKSWMNIPENYKLYVEDGILTESIKVTRVDSTDWTGYVFTEDYDLKSTKEVEKFIKQNKRLPNVPSIQDISKNGLDMVEIDATLLRQIEELWLHLIELKKENNALKEDMKILKLYK